MIGGDHPPIDAPAPDAVAEGAEIATVGMPALALASPVADAEGAADDVPGKRPPNACASPVAVADGGVIVTTGRDPVAFASPDERRRRRSTRQITICRMRYWDVFRAM